RSRDRVAVANPEDDAGVGRSGRKGDSDLLAGVEADPLQGYGPPDRLLAHAVAVFQQCKCHTGGSVESFVYKGATRSPLEGVQRGGRWYDTPQRAPGLVYETVLILYTSTMRRASWRPSRSERAV